VSCSDGSVGHRVRLWQPTPDVPVLSDLSSNCGRCDASASALAPCFRSMVIT
jgi:hypothetical protein